MRKLLLGFSALCLLGGAYAWGDYTATQGSGTTFGSAVVATIHYAKQVICDVTTPAQCAAVSAAGAVKVDNSAVTQPVSVGTWAAGTLGAMANYGTSPGAVLVPGMNAFITNVPAVSQSGTWTVQPGNTANTTPWLTTARLVGNTGATLDFAGQNAASPANSLLMAGQFNTTPTTITTGNASPLQLDNAGNLLVNVKAGAGAASSFGSAFPATGTAVGASDGTNMQSLRVDTAKNLLGTSGITASTGSAWTSATGANATQTLFASPSGPPAVLLQLNQTTTLTGGVVTIEGTYDGTNWITISVAQIVNPSTFANLTNPYTIVQSTNQPFLILTQGFQGVRIRLSTVITGSGSVTPQITLLNYNPTLGALLNPLAAGTAVIGKVGIDQTSVGTSNGVNLQSSASGGCTPGVILTAASNNSTSIKASAGTLCELTVINTTATLVDVRLYDVSAAPTCSSGTGVVANYPVQANTTSPGFSINLGAYGKAFSTGIGICITGANANNDNTNAVTGINVNYGFK